MRRDSMSLPSVLSNARRAIALDAVEAYLDVLRNQELVGIAIENVTVYRAAPAGVRERVAGGQSGAGDLQQAISRLAAASDAKVQVERDLEDTRTRYQRVVDGIFSDLVRGPPRGPPRQHLPSDVGTAVQQALQKSPTVIMPPSLNWM
ncbi:MAG: outer membrane protein LapE [Rhodospirillaceae bacterium]|nr:MAG: outer membrane protein LapE [Rhodospirillaceae bacterium]